MTSQAEIDNLAVLWNKTKDLKYKKLWYKKVKEFAYGRNGILLNSLSIANGRDLHKRSVSVNKRNNVNRVHGIWRRT